MNPLDKILSIITNCSDFDPDRDQNLLQAVKDLFEFGDLDD